MPVDGTGLHRLWYVGGRWAYASALLDGFSDYILITIDLKNPKKPKLAGKYWLPGMNVAAGEKANWPTKNGRFGLHHAIIHDDIAYCSWRDACLAVVDVKNKSNPKLITHKVWAPPFGGGTHNALPLPDRNLLIVVDETVLDDQEDGFKPIWVFDNQVKSNPISIATFPAPSDKDYLKVGGHFGPHNVHENRPGSFQSSELIFATYQNAGSARLRHQGPVPAEGGRARSFPRRRRSGSTRARTARSCSTPPTSSSTRTRSATSPTSPPASTSSNTRGEGFLLTKGVILGRSEAETRESRPPRNLIRILGSRSARPRMTLENESAPPRHPKALLRHRTCASSATPIRTAEAMASRSWCKDGYAYVGHVCSRGFSVIDVRDPTKPKTVNYIENPPNTWSLHLQVHDDLLLLVHGRDMFSQPDMADERNYYKPKAGRHDAHAAPKIAELVRRHGGLRHLQAGRAAPIGFMPVEGTGLHRIWYVGGRWAYASAMIDGFYGLHPHHHRHEEPGQAENRRKILAAGHEPRRGREGELAASDRPLRPAPRRGP